MEAIWVVCYHFWLVWAALHFPCGDCMETVYQDSIFFLFWHSSWTAWQATPEEIALGLPLRSLIFVTKYQTWRKKRGEPEGAKDYREIKRKIRTEMKTAKETWIQGQCQEVEACLRKNNSRKAYQLVKDLTTKKQGKTTTIQDKSGKCLIEYNEILNRRTEYCSTLYNYETDGDLTAHRYQMQSITLFYEKSWKQQSKRWRWESQAVCITYQQNKSK